MQKTDTLDALIADTAGICITKAINRPLAALVKSAPPAIPFDTPVTGMDALDEEKKHALFFLLLTTGNRLQVRPDIDLALFLSCHPIVCQSFDQI